MLSSLSLLSSLSSLSLSLSLQHRKGLRVPYPLSLLASLASLLALSLSVSVSLPPSLSPSLSLLRLRLFHSPSLLPFFPSRNITHSHLSPTSPPSLSLFRTPLSSPLASPRSPAPSLARPCPLPSRTRHGNQDRRIVGLASRWHVHALRAHANRDLHHTHGLRLHYGLRLKLAGTRSET